MHKLIKNYPDLCFEIAKGLKENGYACGSEFVLVQYDDDFVYDSDPEHPESHHKGDVRLYDIYHKNSSEYPGQFELPSLLDAVAWLQTKFNIYFSIGTKKTILQGGVGKRYMGVVERDILNKIPFMKECCIGACDNFDTLEEVFLAGINTALQYMVDLK